MKRETLSIALSALVASAALIAQTPRLVYDVNAVKPSAKIPDVFMNIVHRPTDDAMFLSAQTSSVGRELFKLHGNRIELVKDINPGLASGDPKEIVVAGHTVYFTAYDNTHGRELWKTDGTPAGTVLVQDIRPGLSSSDPKQIRAIGDLVVFSANDGTRGRELWKSDGTAAGTAIVRSIARGAASSFPAGLAPLGGRLLFAATDLANGRELWSTDGTSLGTKLVKDITPGPIGSGFEQMLPAGDVVYFTASDGTTGVELWRTDGTALVADVWPGSLGSTPDSLHWMGNETVFFAADHPTHGRELWKTDGTVTGTVLVKDIYPGTNGSKPLGYTHIGDNFFFAADDGKWGVELWKSDGTPAGTVLVRDIRFNPGSEGSWPDWFRAHGDTIYFHADDGLHGSELWKTDGSWSGTTLVKDVQPGPGGSTPALFTFVRETVFFTASDFVNRALLQTDGTAEGTIRVEEVLTESSRPNWFTAAGSTIFFAADDGVHGNELWKHDSRGTGLVLDIAPGKVSSAPSHPCRLGAMVLFAATHPATGTELWSTDGTSRGTRLEADLYPGAESSSPAFLTRVGSRVVFQTQQLRGASRVWELRIGSSTFPVIYSRTVSATIPWTPHFAPVGDSGDFVFTGVGNTGLWMSDGTAAGTRERVANLSPRELTTFRGKALFSAVDASNGRELWITDGRSTTLLADLAPGSVSSNPRSFAAREDVCFFIARKGVLYQTDGTTRGTVVVKDLGTSAVDSLTIVGSRHLLLRVDGGAESGRELWISDGTAAGTKLLSDVSKGPPSGLANKPWSAGNRQAFAVAGDVFFGADGGGPSGVELWARSLGAHTWLGGHGCGTANRVPRVRATDPVLGSTQRITTGAVKSGALAILLLGFEGRSHLATGCTLWLHPWRPWLLLDSWVHTGGARVTQLAIPNRVSLDRSRLTMQAIVAPTEAPAGFDLSNAVHEVLGR